MVVGVCTIELYLPENQSLKGKRQIVNGLKGKLKNRFNISVAEIDNLDVWQRATIGATMISNDRIHVDRELSKMLNFIESSQYGSYLMDYSIEFIQ
jgi:uncharacterized protein YlxP (DUF503 family)